MIGIVVSRADRASSHIGEHLRDLTDWTTEEDETRAESDGGGTVFRTTGFELREFDALHLEIEGIAEAFDGPDLVVFASKHAGDTGRFLTAHHTGNFGPAEFGGEANAFAEAAPNVHTRVVRALTEHAPANYDVGMECTHHGPTDVGRPSLFVELGSSEEEWNDPAGARAVAKAILDLDGTDPHRERQVVGFGGGHYVPRFERVVRETDWAVGHIGADWALDAMGAAENHEKAIERAFERSGATRAVVEGTKPGLRSVVEDLGYRVVSETWLRETTGVPLALVEHAERELETVDDGLRFGEPARTDGDGVGGAVLERLPSELVAEAEGIDRERAHAAVERHALAFDTHESGTRLADRVLLARADDRDPIVEGFADLLEGKYASVERRDGELVARETAFDPAAAAKLGVPEGPKFGALADGEAVTVGGRTIPPEAVHAEHVRRFARRE
jgi:D-aminoacyl-tRNA deacylase